MIILRDKYENKPIIIYITNSYNNRTFRIMKKSARIFLILTLFAFYGYAVSLCNSNNFNNHFPFSPSRFPTQSYDSLKYSNLFCHIAQTESSILVFRNIPQDSLKKSFNEFSGCFKNIQHLFINIFSQYQFYSKNLIVRLQNTDIIFPFHFFW